MKKVIFVVIATVFLNGCFQIIALVAPAASGVATGNIYQSAISYSVSYGIKKTTGKTIIENVIDLSKDFKNVSLYVLSDGLHPNNYKFSISETINKINIIEKEFDRLLSYINK